MLSVVYSTSPYSMSVVILLYFTLTSCCCKVVCIKCEHSVINAIERESRPKWNISRAMQRARFWML